MKLSSKLFCMAVAAAALLSTPSFAQATATVNVNVPFAFRVGEQTLPAGDYILKMSLGSSLVTIQDTVAEHATMTMGQATQAAYGPDEARVKFRVYGGTHFLSSVFVPNTIQFYFSKSPNERELARAWTPSEVAIVSVATPHR